MRVLRFVERLLYVLPATVFMMLALEGLGITDGLDPLTAACTVAAAASLAGYVRLDSDD